MPYSEEPGRYYDWSNKHVKCSDSDADQQKGAVHPVLSGMELKFMKVCTSILFIIMTLALKVLVLSTIMYEKK